MATRLTAAVLLLALLNACATQRVVRLDMGQGEPLEYRPPTSTQPVKVDAEAFEEALTQLVLNAPLTLRPPRQDWLVRASYPSDDPDTRWQRLMSKSFGGLCEPGQRRDNCLSLLDDVMGLSEWDKLGVALGLSIDPLKESIAKAVENTLAPQLFYTVIATGLITWAVLAANPEPVFTKAAAIVSALLLIYLGVETFLEVVDASRELKWASDRATTWEELEYASKRCANRVGPEVARVFVLAVTVVVSHGMTGGAALLSSRLSMLPSFSEAAAAGAARFGINLANVGQVSAVAVVGSTIVISLPATAVAMGAMGSGSNPSVKAPHIDVPKHNLSRLAPTWAEQRQILIDAVRQLDGKVSAVATHPNGAIFEGTIQVKDTLGNLVDLTIRWFKYADGRITINTAFVPP
ncbi:hypothetical protein [Hyalangium sp.]|uniref:SitA5 family polymorphic toxin n=1 Tax=Hyalangium sp. TaxID=2028555 RepID=UPI002D3E338B|nr:hypothetical protein [Hyalangium sp.]HYI02724.1 hypothetical protein [Hyalangium sp.]